MIMTQSISSAAHAFFTAFEPDFELRIRLKAIRGCELIAAAVEAFNCINLILKLQVQVI